MTATNKYIPGKRIKTWHRAYLRGHGTMSLRQFARSILAIPESDSRSKMERKTAADWLGVSP